MIGRAVDDVMEGWPPFLLPSCLRVIFESFLTFPGVNRGFDGCFDASLRQHSSYRSKETSENKLFRVFLYINLTKITH